MMNRQSIQSLALAGLLVATLSGKVGAQENVPFGPSNYDHNFELFAPLELDLDNSTEDQWSGYFFEYNKLFWSYSGERVMVGSDKVVELIDVDGDGIAETPAKGMFAEIIYQVNPQDDLPDEYNGQPPGMPREPIGEVPLPYLVQNGLTDVPPDAGFAFGNRYELGYRDKDNGWMISVLDGPELHQGQFHGFARRAADGGLPPFIEDDYTGPDDQGPPNRTLISADAGLRAFGFGSVPVLFETPPGYLDGFRDYVNFLADAFTGTQGGPFLYIGNYSAVTPEVVDDDVAVVIPFFRLADDIDGDGIAAADVFVVVGPDGVARLGIIHDFGDLHRFNIFFDNVLVRNTTETNGVEAMWTHILTNQHYMAKNQHNRVTLSWGARFLHLYDEFRVDAEGSILHDAFWDTSFKNQIVGPQVGARWVNRRQRWTLEADGRFMFGYNTADWDQIGLMGEGLIPGALNQPLYARPTAFSHGLQEREFSPVAELRLQARYHVTTAAALSFGYTGMFVGNIRRAAPSVHYRLPDFGYRDAGTQDLLVNGFDLGVEFVY
jgi:hypothetical protein